MCDDGYPADAGWPEDLGDCELPHNRHVIRLLGPWQYEPLARTVLLPDGTTRAELGDLPPSGKMKLPADWGATLGDEFRGRVRFIRNFGRPTGLGPHDRVELVIAHVDAWADVYLADQLLGSVPLAARETRFAIQSQLNARNRLVIEVELPREEGDSARLSRAGREEMPGGIVGEVRLEIVPRSRPG